MDGDLLGELVNRLPVAIALIDADYRIAYANAAFASLVGTPADRAVGRALSEVTPDLAAWFGPLPAIARESGQALPDARCVIGDRRYVATIFPIGSMIALTLRECSTDEAERRFPLDHDAVFRAAFEGAAVGINVIDFGGGGARQNAAFRAMLGYSEDEFARLGVRGITHPDDFAADLTEFHRLMGGEIDRYQIEKRFIKKDGSLLWARLFVSIARDEDRKPLLLISMLEDVTDRHRAEEERERVSRHFERVVESNMCGMAFWDKQGRITDANDAFLQIIGYSREDLAAGRINWLEMTPPEFMDVERRAHAELAERGVCTPFEKAYIRKDGKRVPILIGGALFAGAEEAVGGVTFALDITERKRLEAQLLQSQRLESVGLLAGGIVHDFNNLLAIVLANASLARLSPSNGDALELVEDAALRARTLARQLLTYAGARSDGRAPIDLTRLVRDLSRLVRASIPNNVSVDLALAADLPTTMADGSQIQQVLMNLLINAAEAIGDRPGTVSIATGVEPSPPPELGTERCVYLEVRDTGSGMDEPTQSRIFDPFFSTKRAGRGLGLAAVRAIVRAQGGTITVRSVVHRGTTFRVLLPVGR